MANISYTPFYGRIRSIRPVASQCCQQMVEIQGENGITNFILTPETLVAGSTRLRSGMNVAAFYDGNAPVPLIYPPQFIAKAITQKGPQETVVIERFRNNLTAEDGSLSLNLSPFTEILTANGQRFTCSPGGRLLMVYYTTTTRSIPPQTTPRRIIVLYDD